MSSSLFKLKFDTAEPDDGANVGAYLRSSDGTLITHSTVSGREALDVNIAGGTGFGVYEEDSAHADTDLGQAMLVVRNDAESSLVDADGDYAMLQVDSVGRLRVVADLDQIGGTNSSMLVEEKTVTNAAQNISSLSQRQFIQIQNLGNKSIWLGADNLITVSAGTIEIPPGGSWRDEIGPNIAVWLIATSGSQDVRVFQAA